MAWTAACFTLRGVGKSGSPGPRSTMSRPRARNLAASMATFMVAETLICEIRSDNRAANGIPPLFALEYAPLQPCFHYRRHEAGDIAAQPEDLLDKTRADKRVSLAGHEKDRFDVGSETRIHKRHLQFVFVVRDRPDPPQNDLGVAGGHVVDQETAEGRYLHVRNGDEY